MTINEFRNLNVQEQNEFLFHENERRYSDNLDLAKVAEILADKVDDINAELDDAFLAFELLSAVVMPIKESVDTLETAVMETKTDASAF